MARRLLADGAIQPMESFIERARKMRHGILIDADLRFENEHQAYVYEIHLLDPDGAV